MPEQEAHCLIDLHAISTKNHARPTFSFKPFRPNATKSRGLKAALARESDKVGIDSPQIEVAFSCHGHNGLNCRDIASLEFLLGSGRSARPLQQRSAHATRRSDHTFPPAGDSGL